MSSVIPVSEHRAIIGDSYTGPAEHRQSQSQVPPQSQPEVQTQPSISNEASPETLGKKELSADKRFSHHFDEVKSSLNDRINGLSDVAEVFGERSDAIDHCLAQISELSREVKNASSYLPAHDQKRCTDAIKGLQDRVNEAKDRLSPRSKFSFKSARKNPAVATLDSTSSETLTTTTLAIEPTLKKPSSHRSNPSTRNSSLTNPPTSPSSNSNVIVQAQRDAYITTSTRLTPESGSIINLDGCIVDLSGGTRPCQGLSIQSVKNSLLVGARIDGAAHLTNIKNSIIILTTQQLRMHECENVDVYLSCGSQPIIEDSKDIRFAPIPYLLADKCYDDDDPPEKDLWNQVLDFNWVRAEPSPHWSVMAEADIPKDIEWTCLTTDDLPDPVDTVLRTFKIFKP